MNVNHPFIAFDLEIPTIIPEGETDWDKFKPLGVAVAVLLLENGQKKIFQASNGQASLQMPELRNLVWGLELAAQDHGLVTWNGLGFDFKLLAEESGLARECSQLALDHYDLMFQFFCQRGFCIGLDAAARGMGLPGKTAGMTGAKAPQMWAEGKRQEVIDYCVQDCRTTLELAKGIIRQNGLLWIKASGGIGYEPMSRLHTVRECLEMLEPNTSRMQDPWPRSKFAGWLKERQS